MVRPQQRDLETRPSRAVWIVWAMFAAVVVAIVVTYSRLSPSVLYHVVGRGFVDGGLSRAVVYLNFPLGLAAMYMLLGLADRMSRRLRIASVAAAVLWLPVFSSRVVSESFLDARWGNALPALGVAVALVVTLRTPPRVPLRVRGDGVRWVVGGLAVVLALPWIAAELGFDFLSVPLLGQVFQTQELRRQPGVPALHPAVHYGDHHGLEATLLLITALLVSRLHGAVRGRKLHRAFGVATGLLIAYSLMNIANDAWLEQVVKRGWTAWTIPNVLEPRLNWGWLVIVAGGGAIWASCFGPKLTQAGVDSRVRA